ncbi:hypothetical protein IL38_11325 [Actinopolyspora erythraea]|uniref:Uncharacterized protein n=1 Tax=Actinopolyspora erythraea TaxID=414996 RepID=A0ABR4X526_9ACTN|nr:hypothetical protein IL38_11325 [Actinopolyspora erythraea]
MNAVERTPTYAKSSGPATRVTLRCPEATSRSSTSVITRWSSVHTQGAPSPLDRIGQQHGGHPELVDEPEPRIAVAQAHQRHTVHSALGDPAAVDREQREPSHGEPRGERFRRQPEAFPTTARTAQSRAEPASAPRPEDTESSSPRSTASAMAALPASPGCSPSPPS